MRKNWRDQQKCSHNRIREVREGDLDYDEIKDYLICIECGFLFDREYELRKFFREYGEYIDFDKKEEIIRKSGLKVTEEMLRELEDCGTIF